MCAEESDDAMSFDLMKNVFSTYNRKEAFDAYVDYFSNDDRSESKRLKLYEKMLPIISMVIKANWNYVEEFMLDDLVSNQIR